ncbi:unannotated protein [freshwater metagenome]|uniref:Unannotated protein n=1 Tax=freshwater metagenome TaxID=449393 RepID=A0A6J6UKV7_9ZZZZ
MVFGEPVNGNPAAVDDDTSDHVVGGLAVKTRPYRRKPGSIDMAGGYEPRDETRLIIVELERVDAALIEVDGRL